MRERIKALASSEKAWMAIAMTVAFLLRLSMAARDRVVWGDEPFYLWLGRNWLTGRGYGFMGHPDVHHSPLFPLVTGLLYLLTGSMEAASLICYVLFGTLLLVPVYLLARRIYGVRTAIVTAFLLALLPALAAVIPLWGTMTEPLYLLLVYSGLYAALRAWEEDGKLAYALAGAFFGLAYLTRPEGVGYFVVFLLFLLTVKALERRLSRGTLVGLALYVALFAALLFPYAYYLRQNTGHWMVTEKAGVTFVTGVGLAYGDTAAFDKATWGLDSSGREVYFFSRESYTVSMTEYIRSHPRQVLGMIYRNFRKFLGALLSVKLLPSFLAPFMLLALFHEGWDRARLKKELFLATSLVPALGFLLFFILDRYIAVILPTLVIWSAWGLGVFGEWCLETMRNLWPGLRFPSSALRLLPTLVVLVALLALQPRAIAAACRTDAFRPAHKEAGLWLKEHVPPDSVVMSRYPAIAFHAGTRWVPTPNAEFEALVRYARLHQVDYFVLDERELKLRPQFAFLMDETRTPPELELVHVLHSPRGKIMVYRFGD